MSRTLLIAILIGLFCAGACTSREEKMARLSQKRDLLLLELRELPGYGVAKEEIVAEVRRPASPMDRLTRQMNPEAAAYFADKDARDERDISKAVDAQFRKLCLALGALRTEGRTDSAIDPAGALKSFFDAKATEAKCVEAWTTELEIRAIVKDG
jgi:hypothetical protein